MKLKSLILLASVCFAYAASEKKFEECIYGCRRAAASGNADAQHNLPIVLHSYAADLFNGENGVKKNKFKAIELLRESAHLGNADAQHDLTVVLHSYAADLFNGENGVKKNRLEAVELFRESVRLGNADAQHDLTVALNYCAADFFNGTGVRKDILRAIEFFRESVKHRKCRRAKKSCCGASWLCSKSCQWRR